MPFKAKPLKHDGNVKCFLDPTTGWLFHHLASGEVVQLDEHGVTRDAHVEIDFDEDGDCVLDVRRHRVSLVLTSFQL